MKTENMRIEFEWLDRQIGNDIDQAFFANITLAIGEEFFTRIDDLAAKTVRNHMRGCAHHLATWFAANWWRLRWEPESTQIQNDADWRLAHTVAATGGGYVWPNVIFASDGEYFEVAMLPDTHKVLYEPIRYINSLHTRISAGEFEQKVDGFVEGVISRLHSLGLKDKTLPCLWAEVLAERRDPNASQRRKLEALSGFDPDEAPDELLMQLTEDKANLGKSALEEVAAEARHSVGDVLKTILDLSPSPAGPKPGGVRVLMPDSKGIDADAPTPNGLPWQRASVLAACARKQWRLEKGRVSNRMLADLLGTTPEILTAESTVPTQMPLAFRFGTGADMDIYFNRPRSTSRRFAVSRLIGDQLYSSHSEKLIPATNAKTSRQKFQRAFAQEFLCPIDALLEKIQTHEPDEDDLSEAAAYFEVSPLMVTTTLVNHGKLGREALAFIE
ncbi:MAG: hypothetical protein V2A34_09065 [Lentisphaerota bacterium]